MQSNTVPAPCRRQVLPRPDAGLFPRLCGEAGSDAGAVRPARGLPQEHDRPRRSRAVLVRQSVQTWTRRQPRSQPTVDGECRVYDGPRAPAQLVVFSPPLADAARPNGKESREIRQRRGREYGAVSGSLLLLTEGSNTAVAVHAAALTRYCLSSDLHCSRLENCLFAGSLFRQREQDDCGLEDSAGCVRAAALEALGEGRRAEVDAAVRHGALSRWRQKAQPQSGLRGLSGRVCAGKCGGVPGGVREAARRRGALRPTIGRPRDTQRRMEIPEFHGR
mmetsp:Transcript_29155/g.64743  ORF Transcript_29155/g.64743 Transcript_29155/m.64743 type:complete len:277 (+) Transcript_29155:1185-2015(+)